MWVQGEGSPRRPRGGRGRGRVYKGSLRLSRLVPAGHPQLCSVHGAAWDGAEPLSRLDLLSQSPHLDKVTGGFSAQSGLRSTDETPVFLPLSGTLSLVRIKIQPRLVQA